MPSTSDRILFVTWDGPAQSYLESLYLPMLARIPRSRFEVLQFTWASADRIDDTRRAAARHGVSYSAVRIHRGSSIAAGTALAVAVGVAELRRRRARFDAVWARSNIPAAIVLGAAFAGLDVPILFDADGVPEDERVEFAGWNPRGLPYRAFRLAEEEALLRADAVVTRTRRARLLLCARAGAGLDPSRLFVVPNAKDSDRFSPGDPATRAATRREAGVPSDAPWLLSVGSVGAQYHLVEAIRFFEHVRARHSEARFHVLTGQTDEAQRTVDRLLASDVARAVVVERRHPDQVPELIAAADLGIALRTPSFSQQAISPIKIAEYLLCGVPVLGTRGVGDLDECLGPDTSHLLGVLDRQGLEKAARWFTDEVLANRDAFRGACRATGVAHFDLGACAVAYREAIDAALENHRHAPRGDI